MNKKLENKNGITLIALVITIIVMLILVTVTIRVATDGKLFTHAANAAKETKAHVQNETAILNDDLDKSIDEIVAEQSGELIYFTINNNGTTYKAKNGMTWEQWVNSSYSSDDFEIGDRWKWKLYNNDFC